MSESGNFQKLLVLGYVVLTIAYFLDIHISSRIFPFEMNIYEIPSSCKAISCSDISLVSSK